MKRPYRTILTATGHLRLGCETTATENTAIMIARLTLCTSPINAPGTRDKYTRGLPAKTATMDRISASGSAWRKRGIGSGSTDLTIRWRGSGSTDLTIRWRGRSYLSRGWRLLEIVDRRGGRSGRIRHPFGVCVFTMTAPVEAHYHSDYRPHEM